jgi:NAD(P)-dependent dehydrogenase (short-subunit alcohol dehydrogenase family)
MKFRLKPLEEQVIVITGGSSGIGLATGIEAARRGARVVLAARHEQPLLEARERLAAVGGEAITVIADVGRRAEVQRIASTAIQHYGRFDTWVNNAGWSVFGDLDCVDDADHRRLFETNFWGTVNGSLEALVHLGRTGGALINIGSVASEVALPLQGMYSASKHAVKGFTDALRIEAQDRGLPVSITLVKPSASRPHLWNTRGISPGVSSSCLRPSMHRRKSRTRYWRRPKLHLERSPSVGAAACSRSSVRSGQLPAIGRLVII